MPADLTTVLNNALKNFCERILTDETTTEDEDGVVTRKVSWQFGKCEFRATVVTFAGEASIGTFDFRDKGETSWHKLSTPRAFAEKLTEARI